MNAITNFITHQRTAITTIVVAVLLAIADGLQSGHVVWSDVGYAALTAIAAVAKSALGVNTGTPPPNPTDSGTSA